MPGSVFVFRRAGDCIVITRHKFTNCTMLVVIRHDGTTHSRSFANVESAIVYHQQLECALTGGGWLLEKVVAPEQPSPAVRSAAFG
jgi:hypothetical protein